ncbi:hypothetical protein B296_00027796 [Ensete ventricosum]|uniref:Uncharacterized protein n=1 Tax=Ensete ventricosum TaxID=4639 RepID=A0A426XE57_ENSVE|nr:hypothetical protein B296_00027796 [Ensete ventricosum]
MAAPTPNRYWRLLHDPRFTPPAPNPGPPVVSTKAFLGLTPQVQTLAGMVHTIVPYIPQSAQVLSHQCPDAPWQTLQQGVPQSTPTREEHPKNEVPRCLPNEVMAKNPNTSVIQSASSSRNVIRIPSEPDAASSDSTDLVREQLCQVNQRLDEVQREFVKSKEEDDGETSKGVPCLSPRFKINRSHPAFGSRSWSPMMEALTYRSTSRCLELRWLSTTPLTLGCVTPL